MKLSLSGSTVALLACAVSLAACIAPTEGADDQPGQDGPIGQSSEALTSFSQYGLQVFSDGAQLFDIGTMTGRTCFLRGVGGKLNQNGYADAQIVDNGSHYFLSVHSPEQGVGLKGQAICLGTSARRSPTYISYAGGKVLLEPFNGTRACFLQGVQSFGTNYWGKNADANVDTDGDNWFLITKGNAVATAACVDLGEDLTNAIAAYHGSSQDSAAPVCVLGEVSGPMNFGSVDDGVFLVHRPDQDDFLLTTEPTTVSAGAECFF